MVKTEVLKTLEIKKGSPVSGEALANTLGVSRTAVWKAINNLKKEGYPIETINGKGYILSANSNKLSMEAITNHLKHNLDVLVYKEVASTNTTAIGIANTNPQKDILIVSEEQTSGKGRRGRYFYSPKDNGIYMSLLFKPNMDMNKSILITTAASVAVMRAIKELTGLELKIKWVNDLFLNDKKVCGILTEAVTDFESGQISYVVVGIGINCSNVDVPEEFKDIVGALNYSNLDKNKLIALICDNLLNIISDIQKEDRSFLLEYKTSSMLLGKDINVYKSTMINEQAGIPAKAIDINNDGGLVIQLEDGTISTLSTGEVSVRLNK